MGKKKHNSSDGPLPSAAEEFRSNLPKQAAKLQDHLPKKNDKFMEVEALGRTWRIDRDAIDDDEFMESVGELQDGNPFVTSKVGKHLLGAEAYAEARELLRDHDTGRVRASSMLEFIAEVLQGN